MLWLLWLLTQAHAFCGFYVSGADQSLYSDATLVVMMRSGTTTVLSMQNNYEGPPRDFAMVIPVPQVLQKENVRTLPRSVFATVDALAAPRLVEYWEQDPCQQERGRYAVLSAAEPAPPPAGTSAGTDLGVQVEAQFEVGEYEVVILSAKDSTGLDTWLRREKYNIPPGAEDALRPYVAAGTKFFVAKVNPEKVTFTNGRAVLSPLRVHYESPDFTLPVRLGLLNSKGQQDLIVHILAPGQRYEAANYKNTTIPTNIRVKDAVRENFGAFYDAVFAEVARPGTVVTEYSWDAGSCDPCPVPPLDDDALITLGADVVQPANFVLTRLHYRYDAEGLSEDLVFRAAPPIDGGRGVPDESGELGSRRATPGAINSFQGRYVILHPWEGAAVCPNPRRGMWGGPIGGGPDKVASAPSRLTQPGSAAPTFALSAMLVDALPGGTEPSSTAAAPPAATAERTSFGCDTSRAASPLAAVFLAAFWRKRKVPSRACAAGT